MKKSKFLTCLSAAFITAFALMSCNNVVQGRGHVVLSIDGVEYTAEELFNDQKSPEAAEAKFNGVYKALIRNYFANTTEGQSLKDEVKRETDIKISSKKAEAKSNAKKNGTSYDTEWDKILKDNNCDSTNELYDKFEYDVQKQKFDDKLYDHKFTTEDGVEKTNYDVLREGGYLDGIKTDDVEGETKYQIKGYLKNRFPYHIKHILVKLSEAGKDPVTATITEEEAFKISRIVKALAEGKPFKDIAYYESQDGSGQTAGGSVGIMSKETSFVHEMQFGTYLYDAFYNDTTSGYADANDTKYFPDGYDRLNNSAAKIIFGIDQLPDSTKELENNPAADYALRIAGDKNLVVENKEYQGLADPTSRQEPESSLEDGKWINDSSFSGIGQIPYEAALALGPSNMSYTVNGKVHHGLGDIDFNDKREVFEAAQVTEEVSKKYYPRNVIFNKYFNKHNIMVITPSRLPMYDLPLISAGGQSESIYNENGENSYIKDGEKYGSVRTGKHDAYQGNYDSAFVNEDHPGFNYVDAPASGSGDKTAKNNDTLSTKVTDKPVRDVNLYSHSDTSTTISNENKKVLRDDEGRTILVIRAGTGSNSNDDSGYEGIHFFVLERSPFIDTEYDSVEDTNKTTSINEYYTQYYPNKADHNHPEYDDGTPKKTFAHYLNTTESKEKERADLVKKELTNTASTANTNPNLNIYTYKYLEKKGNISFKGDIGSQIKKQINDWIDTKLDTRSEIKKWNKDWKEYYDQLQYQQYIRNENETIVDSKVTKISSQLISETCAIAFANAGLGTWGPDQQKALKALFDKGGIFHD